MMGEGDRRHGRWVSSIPGMAGVLASMMSSDGIMDHGVEEGAARAEMGVAGRRDHRCQRRSDDDGWHGGRLGRWGSPHGQKEEAVMVVGLFGREGGGGRGR